MVKSGSKPLQATADPHMFDTGTSLLRLHLQTTARIVRGSLPNASQLYDQVQRVPHNYALNVSRGDLQLCDEGEGMLDLGALVFSKHKINTCASPQTQPSHAMPSRGERYRGPTRQSRRVSSMNPRYFRCESPHLQWSYILIGHISFFAKIHTWHNSARPKQSHSRILHVPI